MNLVFYSGGEDFELQKLDLISLKLTNKTNPKITYIPACSYDSEVDFYEFVDRFTPLGLEKFIYFPIDVRYGETLFKEAFSSDIIHLSGGNTYYFLKWIRRNSLEKVFKSFIERGGVLTGLSAGAIIMTPNIETAGFPDFDKDENEDNLKNLSSLGFVDFEFFPHYRNSKRYDSDLIKRSKEIDWPLYACADGSGIVVSNNVGRIVGKSYQFLKGKKSLMKNETFIDYAL